MNITNKQRHSNINRSQLNSYFSFLELYTDMWEGTQIKRKTNSDLRPKLNRHKMNSGTVNVPEWTRWAYLPPLWDRATWAHTNTHLCYSAALLVKHSLSVMWSATPIVSHSSLSKPQTKFGVHWPKPKGTKKRGSGQGGAKDRKKVWPPREV